ncbi:MAG: PilZ domain-containing protein [Myxococcales bacterium]|jgi:hypothetical protein
MRRSPRFTKRLVVRFATGDGAWQRSGCTLDLSDGGLFLNSRFLLPQGARVLGSLELPGGSHIELRAVVSWQRPTPKAINDTARGGMGLRLVWAEPAYFELLSSIAA